uniref:Uncharacterized protein n=2 Tax=Cannabis sativa TaxID=3483 RepID=A0A803NSF0_CANSA
MMTPNQFPSLCLNPDLKQCQNLLQTLHLRLSLPSFMVGVKIFDGIPEEKVNEIIMMAAATAAAIKSSNMNNMEADNASSLPVPPRSPAIQNLAAVGSLLAQLCPAQKSSLNKLQAEFPIARRHSLQSFLEKRRNRLVSKSPYPSSPMMKVENDSVV